MYETLHWLHAALAVLSGSGFVVRGVWRLLDSPLLELSVVRIAPHVVDALLFALGVAIAIWSARSPFEHPWLLAKLLALIAYVGLGLVALRFARTLVVRSAAFATAIAVFGYMLAVATTRQIVPCISA